MNGFRYVMTDLKFIVKNWIEKICQAIEMDLLQVLVRMDWEWNVQWKGKVQEFHLQTDYFGETASCRWSSVSGA